jgi:hypothetical protein
MSSNRPSFTWLPCNLRDDATCTNRRRSSTSFQAKLENPSPTYFTMKQAAECRRVSSHRLHPFISFEAQTDRPPPTWFWGSNQETVVVILRPKSPNHDLGFEAQRMKPVEWFLGQTTDKPSPPVLRLNRKTCASCLLNVYDVDHTRHHPTTRSSSHQVPDLCLIIPDPLHHVSYSVLILVVVRHVAFTTYTSCDKQTRFSTLNNSIWVSATKMRRIKI